MARYNSIITQATASTSATQTAPTQGLFTELTGSSYTLTIADPSLYTGYSQTFWNNASGVITLASGGSGIFKGPGSSGTSSLAVPVGSTITLFSDGTNWITAFDGGGPLVATTVTATSTVSLSPSSAGVTISPSSGNVVVSPSGTGSVTISPANGLTVNPTILGTMDNVKIGATTASDATVNNFVLNTAMTGSGYINGGTF